jgi:hypothetical protein
MNFHTTFSLPLPRAEQLREIAKHRGHSVSDILDDFIRREWTALGRDPELPPFEIMGTTDHETGKPMVIFTAYRTVPVFLTPDQAERVAGALGDLISGAANNFLVPVRYKTFHGVFLGEKKGRGFIFRIADDLTSSIRTVVYSGLTRSIAVDLQSAFTAAAKSAIFEAQENGNGVPKVDVR